jgi:hypothetical protein
MESRTDIQNGNDRPAEVNDAFDNTRSAWERRQGGGALKLAHVAHGQAVALPADLENQDFQGRAIHSAPLLPAHPTRRVDRPSIVHNRSHEQ